MRQDVARAVRRRGADRSHRRQARRRLTGRAAQRRRGARQLVHDRKRPSAVTTAPFSEQCAHRVRTAPFRVSPPTTKPRRLQGLREVGGTGLEPVTPSLSSPHSCYAPLARTPSLSRVCRNLCTLPAAAFALVLGLRLPLQLARVSTAAAASSRQETCSPTSASRSAAVGAHRSHRRRRVVALCHSGARFGPNSDRSLAIESLVLTTSRRASSARTRTHCSP